MGGGGWDGIFFQQTIGLARSAAFLTTGIRRIAAMGVSFFCSSVYSRYISTYYVCVVRIYLYGSTIFFLVEMPTPAFCFLVLLFVGCAPLCMYVQLQEICLLVRLKEHTFGTFSSFLFEMQPTRRRTQNNSRDNHTLPSVSVLFFLFSFCRGLPVFFHDN